MRLIKTLTLCIAIGLVGCAHEIAGESVKAVLDNREEYFGREVVVSGRLMITPQKTAICEGSSTDACINLAVPVEIYNELKKSESKIVTVRGVYADHGFKNKNGETVFYPSRLVVSEMIKTTQ